MHKLIATSTILEHELSELRLLVERQTGIVLDCPNSALATHVADYVEGQGLGSTSSLLESLRSPDQDPSRLPLLLDGLIAANTGFFRHPGAMNALTRQVVPQLCARKSADGPTPLRFWSAGCATGEETYSIAISVCDALSQIAGASAAAGNPPMPATKSSARNGGIAEAGTVGQSSGTFGWGIHVVGSDLLPGNIETADRGIYRQSAVEGLPSATIRSYFSKISSPAIAAASTEEEAEVDPRPGRANANGNANRNGNAANGTSMAHLLVKPRLRSLVTFNCMNLARPGYIGRFDCIFCMDVLPHLSRPQRIALLERLHLYLEPGGYLFLSQTEKLIASNLNFRSETFDGYTYHRKPVAASAAYGR